MTEARSSSGGGVTAPGGGTATGQAKSPSRLQGALAEPHAAADLGQSTHG